MKKNLALSIISFLLIGLMSFASPLTPPQSESLDIYVNGVLLPSNYYKADSSIMVPLRLVSEALGYTVQWFEDGHIELTKGPRFITLKTTANYYTLGKMAPQSLSSSAVIKNNTTYVPSDFVTELLDTAFSFQEKALMIEARFNETVETSGFTVTKIEGDWIYATLNGQEAHIRISNETTYGQYGSEKSLQLNNVAIGDTLKVTHPSIMLAIYPPQYAALHIELVNEVGFRSGVITEINESAILIDTFETGIQINIGPDTKIVDSFGNAISLSELRIGNRVSAYHSLMMTFSIPPQSPGLRIVRH